MISFKHFVWKPGSSTSLQCLPWHQMPSLRLGFRTSFVPSHLVTMFVKAWIPSEALWTRRKQDCLNPSRDAFSYFRFAPILDQRTQAFILFGRSLIRHICQEKCQATKPIFKNLKTQNVPSAHTFCSCSLAKTMSVFPKLCSAILAVLLASCLAAPTRQSDSSVVAVWGASNGAFPIALRLSSSTLYDEESYFFIV